MFAGNALQLGVTTVAKGSVLAVFAAAQRHMGGLCNFELHRRETRTFV
jgi:hypothetical protein